MLKIGDKVRIKGPKGQFKYHPSLSRELGMIAGGTGITPMLQIIRAALKNPLDRTKLTLIYANVNVEDILLRTELDELAEKHKDRFTVYYVLNNPPPNWKGGVGFVTKDQVERFMPPTDHNIKVLMCGKLVYTLLLPSYSNTPSRSPSYDDCNEVSNVCDRWSIICSTVFL